jgi:quercetin dioxygenase-like cupin family protein
MFSPAYLITLAFIAGANGRGDDQPHAATGQTMDISIHKPNDLKWSPAPPVLPRGAKIAVLEGDPSKDGPFVFRALLPDGYRIPPHTHSKVERITVISGTFNVGMGDKFDQGKTRAMPAGTYGFWPAGMKHFVWAKGETVIQFHGIGPWSLTYVNPDDDPRKAKIDERKSGPQAMVSNR